MSFFSDRADLARAVKEKRDQKLTRQQRRRLLLQELLEDRRLLFAGAVHEDITAAALQFLKDDVLQQIGSANSGQLSFSPSELTDRFLGSDFQSSAHSINGYYEEILDAANPSSPNWSAVAENFGKILHSAQSFYANTNWIDLIDYCDGNSLSYCSYQGTGSNSLAEGNLSFWDNFTPYSQLPSQSLARVVVVQGEDVSPRTPFGVGSLASDSRTIAVGETSYEAQVVLVTTPAAGNPSQSQTLVGLTSGISWWLPDDAPDTVAIEQTLLYKGDASHPRFEMARSLAEAQTQHELARLVSLIEERYGSAEHLRQQWLREGEDYSSSSQQFDELMQAKRDAASLSSLRQALHDDDIQHVTILTHGASRDPDTGDWLTSGDSLINMAQALHHRTGGWLADHDVSELSETRQFQIRRLEDQLPSGHLVLLFDWSREANQSSSGWTEAAGEALFTMLADLGVIDLSPSRENSRSLHFIAHSMGSAVQSNAIERLAAYQVPVTQATYLDPHDFDQNLQIDTAHAQHTLGMPQLATDGPLVAFNYGVTHWDNIAFSDVYFQTRGHTPMAESVLPAGRPIPGAFNVWLNSQDGLPQLSGYPESYVNGDHDYVWDYWYASSIIGTAATDNLLMPVFASGVNSLEQHFQNRGYSLTEVHRELSSSGATADRPSGNFFNLPTGLIDTQEFPHTYSSALIVDPVTGLPAAVLPDGTTVQQLQSGSWPARILPRSQLFNGDFVHSGDGIGGQEPNIPGWSFQGGGGSGSIVPDGPRSVLRLNAGQSIRTHNAFFLDEQAGVLSFDYRVVNASDDDQLEVLLGNQTLARLNLETASEVYTKHRIAIPQAARQQIQRLTFRLVPAIGSSLSTTVHIDQVGFALGGRTGDLIPIDLQQIYPAATGFHVLGWELRQTIGDDGRWLFADRDPSQAIDRLGFDPSGNEAFAIYSDAFDPATDSSGMPFSGTGRLLFAPPVSTLAGYDRSSDQSGLQGTIRLWTRFGESPRAMVVDPAVVDDIIDRLLTIESEADRIEAISLLQSAFVENVDEDPLPLLSLNSHISQLDITQDGESYLQQWLISDASNDSHWALVRNGELLELYSANFLEIETLPGGGLEGDAQAVSSGASSRFEVAQVQQRLRFLHYPGFDGQLPAVNGTVTPDFRHALGLFNASVSGNQFSPLDSPGEQTTAYLNAANAPRWTELGSSEHFEVVNGPFQDAAPFHGTSWLVTTIRETARELKTGDDPIQMPISIGSLSKPNGPGSGSPHEPAAHTAGLGAQFLLSPGAAISDESGLTELGMELLQLIATFERVAQDRWGPDGQDYRYSGITVKEMRFSDPRLVQEINRDRLLPIAIHDSEIAENSYYLEIVPPPPQSATDGSSASLDQAGSEQLQHLFQWLSQRADFDPESGNLPGLRRDGLSIDPAIGSELEGQVSLAEIMGLGAVLTNSPNSLDQALIDLLDGHSSADLSQVANQLTGNRLEIGLQLPKNASIGAERHVDIQLLDGGGTSHPATMILTKIDTNHRWSVQLEAGGQGVGGLQILDFSSADGRLLESDNGLRSFGSFQPSADVLPISVAMDFAPSGLYALSTTEEIWASWMNWATVARANFNAFTGEAALQFELRGLGVQENLRLDTDFLDGDTSFELLRDRPLSLSISGLLDFTVQWKTLADATSQPETFSLWLKEYRADVDLLDDSIQHPARFGWLEGQLVDSGTLQNPGPQNSFLKGDFGFQYLIPSSTFVDAGSLDLLAGQLSQNLQLRQEMDGVFFFESSLAGVALPGDLWISLDLGQSKLIADSAPELPPTWESDIQFDLIFNDDSDPVTRRVVIPQSVLSGVSTIEQLAAVSDERVQEAISDTAFSGQVDAAAVGQRLVFTARGESIRNLSVQSVTLGNVLTLDALGFSAENAPY
jgi:hypothetical protein